jgi:hypothetical protein
MLFVCMCEGLFLCVCMRVICDIGYVNNVYSCAVCVLVCVRAKLRSVYVCIFVSMCVEMCVCFCFICLCN